MRWRGVDQARLRAGGARDGSMPCASTGIGTSLPPAALKIALALRKPGSSIQASSPGESRALDDQADCAARRRGDDDLLGRGRDAPRLGKIMRRAPGESADGRTCGHSRRCRGRSRRDDAAQASAPKRRGKGAEIGNAGLERARAVERRWMVMRERLVPARPGEPGTRFAGGRDGGSARSRSGPASRGDARARTAHRLENALGFELIERGEHRIAADAELRRQAPGSTAAARPPAACPTAPRFDLPGHLHMQRLRPIPQEIENPGQGSHATGLSNFEIGTFIQGQFSTNWREAQYRFWRTCHGQFCNRSIKQGAPAGSRPL